MRSEKGKRKKAGAYFYSLSIHTILIALLCFPFLETNQSEKELFEGLLVKFDSQQSAIPKVKNRNPKKSTRKTKLQSQNPSKEAAETKFLKPKLESARKVDEVKHVPKSTSEELQTQPTLTEKRRDFLVKAKLEATNAKVRTERNLQRIAEEKKAKKEKYEKMQNAFSQLLKNANHETSNTSPDFDLYDKSLDESSESTHGADAQSIGNREVLFIPEIKDNSQKEGRVVIKICVDASGKVTKARYTQSGSTTTDKYLIDLAISNAKLYRFAPLEIQEQCGRVNIDFELR